MDFLYVGIDDSLATRVHAVPRGIANEVISARNPSAKKRVHREARLHSFQSPRNILLR